jgi:hypothetical protein
MQTVCNKTIVIITIITSYLSVRFWPNNQNLNKEGYES